MKNLIHNLIGIFIISLSCQQAFSAQAYTVIDAHNACMKSQTNSASDSSDTDLFNAVENHGTIPYEITICFLEEVPTNSSKSKLVGFDDAWFMVTKQNIASKLNKIVCKDADKEPDPIYIDCPETTGSTGNANCSIHCPKGVKTHKRKSFRLGICNEDKNDFDIEEYNINYGNFSPRLKFDIKNCKLKSNKTKQYPNFLYTIITHQDTESFLKKATLQPRTF